MNRARNLEGFTKHRSPSQSSQPDQSRSPNSRVHSKFSEGRALYGVVADRPPATPWQPSVNPSVGYALSPYSSQTLQKLGHREDVKDQMRLSDSERSSAPAGRAISKIKNHELDTRQNFEGRRSGMKVNDLSTIKDPDSAERLLHASPVIHRTGDPSKV